MKLLTTIAAVAFIALPAHATMETRQQLGCVLIPIPNTNAWQRMTEGCEFALPSTEGGGIIYVSPRPKPRPPTVIENDGSGIFYPTNPDPVDPVDPPADPKPPTDPKPDHPEPPKDKPKHEKPKSDNSDSNGKGGNKHDRQDKPQGPKNK